MYDNTHTFPPDQRSLLEEAAIVHHINSLFLRVGEGGIFNDASIKKVDRYNFNSPQVSGVQDAPLPTTLQEMLEQSGDSNKADFFKAFRQHIFAPENREAYQKIVDSFADVVRETNLDFSSTSVFKADDGYRIYFTTADVQNADVQKVQMQIWLEAQRLQESTVATDIESRSNYLTVHKPSERMRNALEATHPRDLTPQDIWQNVADYFAGSATAKQPTTLTPLQEQAVRERISQYYDQCGDGKLDDFWVQDPKMQMMQHLSGSKDKQKILRNYQYGNPNRFEEMKAWSFEQAKRDTKQLEKITTWYMEEVLTFGKEQQGITIEKQFARDYTDGQLHTTFGIKVEQREGETEADYVQRKAAIE